MSYDTIKRRIGPDGGPSPADEQRGGAYGFAANRLTRERKDRV